MTKRIILTGNEMEIYRPSPQILIVTQSRLSHIGLLLFYIVFYVFWYYNILGLGSIPEDTQFFDYFLGRLSAKPSLCIGVLVPIVLLPSIYKTIRIVAVGEQLTFDGTMRGILKNGKPMARFDEVAHLEVKSITDAEGGDEHRLTALLYADKRRFGKIEIHSSSDLDKIISLANDVKDIVKVNWIRKD